jgi:hypothetical protein
MVNFKWFFFVQRLHTLHLKLNSSLDSLRCSFENLIRPRNSSKKLFFKLVMNPVYDWFFHSTLFCMHSSLTSLNDITLISLLGSQQKIIMFFSCVLKWNSKILDLLHFVIIGTVLNVDMNCSNTLLINVVFWSLGCSYHG